MAKKIQPAAKKKTEKYDPKNSDHKKAVKAAKDLKKKLDALSKNLKKFKSESGSQLKKAIVEIKKAKKAK